MLSETDIHYITGFLYLVSRRSDITVVLGERVRDEASESDTDVDIVIATIGEHGLVGVEVKDEGRPLHVGVVEGICQKFTDMPDITSRAIVSASGFTSPAIRKATAHGVTCLALARGRVPRFRTIDLSRVSEVRVSYLEWRTGPHITLLPNLRVSDAQRAELSPETQVQCATESSDVRTLKDIADRITAQVTSEWEGPPVQAGPINISIDVAVTDHPVAFLSSGDLPITQARLSGTVEWVSCDVPVSEACYLKMPEGEPFAATALVTIRSGLFGLAVSSSTQELRLFHLPDAIRNIRPIRRRIGGDQGRTT